ncbi:transcription termination/antitermination NusG family protein, partial [Enterobacter sp. ZOR0014]
MQDTFTDAWYLLRCRQNYWKTIQQNLNEAGLKTCCPLILERRRRSDKKNAYRLINSPAFPGYIFVRFNPANIHTTAIKRIPGAMDFVRFGNEIATISQAEIEALKLVHFERPQEKINLP